VSDSDSSTPTKPCLTCARVFPATTEFFYRARGGLCAHCKACCTDRQRAYRRAHPEKLAIQRDRYRRNHPDQRRAERRKWKLANPMKVRASRKNWKIRAIEADGTHTVTDIQAQYERQNGKCFYCGKKVGSTYHVDHVIPLARGGSNGPENLVIACPKCNLKKSAQHPMDFAGIMF
jgi:5-methylcytosine-specific restriction endonuclease McrA